MKTEKFNNSYWFYYKFLSDGQIDIVHGLLNGENHYIGYNYKGQMKGFWLW